MCVYVCFVIGMNICPIVIIDKNVIAGAVMNFLLHESYYYHGQFQSVIHNPFPQPLSSAVPPLVPCHANN